MNRAHHTALMRAVYCNNLEAVKLLMNLEAKIQDMHGLTALMIAIRERNIPIAKLLIEIEMNCVDNFG